MRIRRLINQCLTTTDHLRLLSMRGDKNDYGFQRLVESLLQIKSDDDKPTDKVFTRLEREEGGLTVNRYAELFTEDIEKKISDVSIPRKKAEYIKLAAVRIRDELQGKFPETSEELQKFKGVGPKVAKRTFEYITGMKQELNIGLHAHRIANVLGWVKQKKVKDTATDFQKLFPNNIWDNMNETLEVFGEQMCHEQNPACKTCSLVKICQIGRLSNMLDNAHYIEQRDWKTIEEDKLKAVYVDKAA